MLPELPGMLGLRRAARRRGTAKPVHLLRPAAAGPLQPAGSRRPRLARQAGHTAVDALALRRAATVAASGGGCLARRRGDAAAAPAAHLGAAGATASGAEG